MNKIWYIQIEGRKEGPYSPQDLKRDPRVTPDTLVWKEGFKDWIPIRYVQELKEVFKDEKEEKEEGKKNNGNKRLSGDMVLALKEQNPNFIFLLLLIIALLFYIFYQIYNLQ